MAMSEVRLGVVGMRNIGKNHVRRARELAGCRVMAVADTDATRLGEARDEFGAIETHADAAAMFACDAVDAVVLAVPNAAHAPLTIAALEAGKHVLVEKPISRTVEEADAMIAARDASGKVLMVGMNQRFNPRTEGIGRAIAAGVLGRLQFGRTWWMQVRPAQGLWGRGDWFLSAGAAGGGPMIDLGIHRLDLAMHLLGFPAVRSVTGVSFAGIGRREASKRGKAYEIEDGAVGLVRFEDGSALEVAASYCCNTTTPGQNTILHGDSGSVDMAAETPVMTYASGEPMPVAIEPVGDVAASCVEHFARVLRGEEPLVPTAEQGRLGLRIVEAIYESGRTGKTIEFGEQA